MAVSRIKEWVSGEVLNASDLNTELDNLNQTASAFPLTENVSAAGYAISNAVLGTLKQLNENVYCIDNYASLAAAISGIGSATSTLLINKNVNVTANATVPSTLTLWFVGAGKLTVSVACTATINGPIRAEPRQIFDGSGTVAFTSNYIVQEIVPQWWGAVANNSTDATNPIQLTLDAAATFPNSAGCAVFFHAGKYYCANNGGSGQLQIKSSVTLRGAGMHRSVFQFDDSASGSRRDLLVTDTSAAYDITLDSLGFVGDWGTTNYTERSHLVELTTTGRFVAKHCRFASSRYMALVVVSCTSAYVDGCHFYRIAADGCRITRSSNVVITNNFFDSVNDDCIAVHSADAQSAPLQRGITIANNVAVDSQGITVAGAKQLDIVGNVLRRSHTRAIQVGSSSATTEGQTAGLSINITGNIIDTVFDGFAFSASSGSGNDYIFVETRVPTTNGSGYVGQPNGSGGVVSPFAYFYTNDVDGTAPNPGNWFVNISDNICVRTLTTATNYSDYGYGTRYSRSGPVDPAITAANLGSARPQISVTNHGCGVKIDGNICWGGGYGIWLDGTASSAYLSWQDVLVANNQIGNFVTAGVYVEGEGHASLHGNVFDGDPLHVHADRGANGTWGAGWENHAAIWVAGCNASVVGCEFRNVGTIYKGSNISNEAWRANVVYCNPAALGYNASNEGIGSVQRPTIIDAAYVIEDGDPASATYGTVLNSCPLAATAVPSAGTYVTGYIVRNAAPSVAGSASSQYVVSGWLRLTMGSGHVLDTDWVEMRTLTGT